jgi:MFS superfamily sulfate permease-like transporter
MAKTFAKKHKYKIDANQELIALGSANIFSSFFNCYTSSSSLSRSSVLDRVGAKSQIANLFSSVILLITIQFLGPLLFHLPAVSH